jgi:uncharacterized membrane protein YozB (DUF420 family)
MNAGLIILVLKIAVVAVTVLLGCSMVALARGRYRLHGRINIAFFVLTLAALVGLELIAQLLRPGLFLEYLERHKAMGILWVHLAFSIPSALLLTVMLFTGLRHQRNLHVGLGIAFLILWMGTFITGVFFLPHEM